MRTILLAAIFACCCVAQTPSEPPFLIRLVRNGSIQPYANAKAAVNVLGMNSVSGTPEPWFIEMHDSFGSIEDLDKAFGRIAPPANTRTMIAIYRPELSYRPGEAIKGLVRARYIEASVYHIRPGAEADFAELVKLRANSLDSMNIDRPDMAYQVISGGLSGTYVFLMPLASLRVMDSGRPTPLPSAEPAVDASVKARRKIAGEAEISHENRFFRVEPLMSYVSQGFASADPDFWGVRQ